jgi:hypothetical protein
VGLKINGTHQILVYADDVILLRDNISTKNRNIWILIGAGWKADLEINAEKNKYKSRYINSKQIV